MLNDIDRLQHLRVATITPQAFRSGFCKSDSEFAAVVRAMTESGRVRDGKWDLDQAHAELRITRMMQR